MCILYKLSAMITIPPSPMILHSRTSLNVWKVEQLDGILKELRMISDDMNRNKTQWKTRKL